MKLRSLFLSTLVICAFSACSNDDEVIQGPVEPVDASVSFAATTLAQTKATEDVNGNETKDQETYINELHAFVFKAPEGETDESKMTLVGQGKVSSVGTSVNTINHIIIKVTPNKNDQTQASSDKFKAVLIANPGVSLSPASLSELKSVTLTKSIQKYPYGDKNTYLPMISDVIEVKDLVPIIKQENGTTQHKENWISKDGTFTQEVNDGDLVKPDEAGTIVLTRLVARVQVDQIISKIHESYKGSSFELTNLSLVNVRPLATMVDGKGDGNYEYVKGFESMNYALSENWIYPKFTGVLLTEEYSTALSKNYSKVIFSEDGITSWTPSNNEFYSYAFPNATTGEYKTALLITGRFKRNANDIGAVKNFRVILQDKTLGADAIQIVRNNVYKLVVTITGEGSSNEDNIELNAHISVDIQVAKWFVVNQDETDVN